MGREHTIGHMKYEPAISSGAGPSASEEGEIDFKGILAQLLARWKLIALLSVTGASIGAYFGQLPDNVFQASAVVQIEERSDRIRLPSELIGDLLAPENAAKGKLSTEVHVIRSRLVLGPVVERLERQTRVVPRRAPVIGDIIIRRELPIIEDYIDERYVRAGEHVDLSLVDVPNAYIGAKFTLVVLSDAAFLVMAPSGEELRGEVGVPIDLPLGGKILVSKISSSSGRHFDVVFEPLRAAVQHISRGLKVQERSTTGVVDFTYQDGKPDHAVLILNEVIAEYVNQNLRRRSVEIDQSIAFIQDQLVSVAQELKFGNEDLAAYRQNRQLEELSVGTQELLTSAVEIEAQLEELSFQREQLLAALTTNHPNVKAIEAQEQRLQLRLAGVRDSLSKIPEVEQELARLVQRVGRAQALELQLNARIEQLRILRASAVGNIRVLEPAEAASLVGPDRRRPILFGFLAGLMAGTVLVLAFNAFRRGIEDGRDIEALGLPLFATVNREDRLKAAGASNPVYGLAMEDPTSLTVEALRGLRTGLKFAMANASSKVLMITSCAPADGKSFIALNLAIVAGKAGAKVLLIDADMRRGLLRRYFGLDRHHPGLSDVLTDDAEHCIVHDEKCSIDFMPTGRLPPNPSELLEGDAFAKTLSALEAQYDLIVIDAPPALLVADPAIIGQRAGMSMLVVRHLHTSPAEIEAVRKTFANAGVRLSGAVLNQYDERKSRYGRYGRKYGYYYGGYRYKYDADHSKE
jgi:tyrosine-protein kinase Etk/Wzc